MSRPSLTNLLAGIEGWDSIFNDDMAVLAGPFPVKEYANFAALAAVDPANYTRCIAATTNDHRLWISNGVAWVPVGGGGSTYGAHTLQKVAEATSGALSGAAYTFTGLVPASVFCLGISVRVTTLIEGATTFDIGDGADVDRYGAAIALAAGTTTGIEDSTANPTGWTAAAGDVVLTANVSNFTAGVVHAAAHYIALTAPQA